MKALSGWYSLVGVLAQERMMSMLNTEKPTTIVVVQSRTVLRKTLSFLSERNRPQKSRASSATRKKAAPELYGRPSVLTKNRSKYAASLGR